MKTRLTITVTVDLARVIAALAALIIATSTLLR